MNKKLYTQIKNEWRGNLWLLIELLLVSVILWFISDALYCRFATYLEPRGFDTEHCYKIELGVLTEKSTDYKPYEKEQQQLEDLMELLERLKRRPEVEAVSLSSSSHPYNGSNSGIVVRCDSMLCNPSNGFVVRRYVQPDFVRVFRYRGANGETSEQLAEMLERGEVLFSDNLFEEYGIPVTSLVGKEAEIFGEGSTPVRIGAALQVVRYSDYHSLYGGFAYSAVYNIDIIERHTPGFIGPWEEVCVRVRADRDKDFIERLKADSESRFRIGNIYISEVYSFTDIRRTFLQGYVNDMRNYLMGMGFLLLNIFLGLLGTFWFRTQQRRKDIALHMIAGATRRAVFRRLLSEGMILLLLVTPGALVADYILTQAELNAWYAGSMFSPGRFLFCAAISFALIALMILIGICIPARKAMALAPAEVLHDE